MDVWEMGDEPRARVVCWTLDGRPVFERPHGDRIMTSGREIASGWIVGTPRAAPRPRFVGGRVVSWRAAGRATAAWRVRVERELAQAVERLGDALEGARGVYDVGVSLRFVFPTTDQRRHGAPHGAKPDTDNLVKLWMDAACKVGLLLGQDDSHVAGLESFKVWGSVGGVGWTVRALERVKGGTDRVSAGRWWEGADAPAWVG